MDVRVLAESENFIMYRYVFENGNSKRESLQLVLTFMEKLRSKGLRPLHYIPFSEAFVCEKLPSVRSYQDPEKEVEAEKAA